MAPTRPLKRQKTNTDDSPKDTAKPSQVPLPPDSPTRPEPPTPPAQDSPGSPWYRTWPRKAAPVTQIARESASIASDVASEVSSIIRDKTRERRASARNPSLAMTLGKTASNRSLPVDAATTNIHAMPEAVSPSKKGFSQPDPSKPNSKVEKPTTNGKEPEQKKDDPPTPPETEQATPKDAARQPQQDGSKNADNNRASWFAWMSNREEVTAAQADNRPQDSVPASVPAPVQASSGVSKPTQSAGDAPPQPSKSKKADIVEAITPNNKRTWLQMWGSDAPAAADPKTLSDGPKESSKVDPVSRTKALDIPQPATPNQSSAQSQASSIETSPPPPLPGDASKSSAWVFWSRDKKNNTSISLNEEQPHVGEIAISDTPSQTRPKRASISVPKDQDMKPELKLVKQTDSLKNSQPAKAESIKQPEKDRPQTPTADLKGHAKKDARATKLESPNATARAQEPVDVGAIQAASPTPSKKYAENLLLPTFKETLSMQENPSILQQLARLLYYTKEPELKHLSIVKDPPRIRNALAIGVHGYFPGTMVRTLLGQPTGTSIKFADMAAKSIRKWTRGHGHDCKVKTAALEGEGKIAERVELLWKLLLNWIDEIRKADFVMVACHSQGVPVAIMLVAKLIQFGCITSARVGICAMAGVNLGPFVDFKSRWISGSAGELFEFSDPSSKVSGDYTSGLEVILEAGVRLTYIGSIDDQLVSLESSIFAPISHPHIYRAVSIDSRIHAPNFLSHLVGFVLKLRNLGVQDHGLIKELSSPLAGSLYTGEGHSRIYEDDAVYDLAVTFALETTTLASVPISKRNTAPSGGNPYILPFAMRGILEEDFVKTELQEEAQELLRQFDEWRPTTKALKDVKFRLEGVRSKL